MTEDKKPTKDELEAMLVQAEMLKNGMHRYRENSKGIVNCVIFMGLAFSAMIFTSNTLILKITSSVLVACSMSIVAWLLYGAYKMTDEKMSMDLDFMIKTLKKETGRRE